MYDKSSVEERDTPCYQEDDVPFDPHSDLRYKQTKSTQPRGRREVSSDGRLIGVDSLLVNNFGVDSLLVNSLF